MTFRAARRRFRKDQIHVTAGARHVLVQAQQRELSLGIVVELRLLPDGLPGCGRMTVFASDIE